MALCSGYLASCIQVAGPRKEPASLRVFFLDVGQGDACLFRTPGHQWFLYDTGNKEENLLSFLNSAGVDTLAAVFISHPDRDHFGALASISPQIPVKKLYLPLFAEDKPGPDAFWGLDAFQGEKDTLYAGDTLVWDTGVKARVLWPFRHALHDGNELSTVLRIEYGSRSVLLTGDIGNAAEMEMLRTGIRPSAEIYKAAHHGSRTSNGLPFLSAVGPRWAVISCDPVAYGHPHEETLAGLSLILGDSARILRTYRDGNIGFELGEHGIMRLARTDFGW